MGALNFSDTLVALGCRELGIEYIATFDSDFDSITWHQQTKELGTESP